MKKETLMRKRAILMEKRNKAWQKKNDLYDKIVDMNWEWSELTQKIDAITRQLIKMKCE